MDATKLDVDSNDYCTGWLDGFIAACLLKVGDRKQYEMLRDLYLSRKMMGDPNVHRARSDDS